MKFRKYTSIENSTLVSFIEKIKQDGFADEEFLVQEKVHGSNLSILTNGKEIRFAKRTEILDDEATFFQVHLLRHKYEQRILHLFASLKNEFEIETLTVFGEYFGGYYPHKSVPKNTSAKTIQKGVYYSPNNDFYAFDILINNHRYLDVDTCNRFFVAHDFLHAHTLFRGDLTACLSYNNAFQSTLPTLLHLPKLEDNVCEGVIIRPVKPLFLTSGSRILLKNKNDKWSEKSNSRDKQRLKKLVSEEIKLSKECDYLLDELLQLINENRFSNVASKVGEVEFPRDLGKMTGLICKDIFQDFIKEFESSYVELEKSEQKIITKQLNQRVGLFLKEKSPLF